MTTSTNYVQQLAGDLSIEMVDNDDLLFTVTWGFDITSYTFVANIIPAESEEEIAMAVTVINATTGEIQILITSSSITDISPSINRWYLKWTDSNGYERTVLAGALVLRAV